VAESWYPGGVDDRAPEGLWGTHAPGYAPKVVLHTTEGGLGVYTPDTRRGAARRYYGHTFWPNYTLARHGRDGPWRIFNHIPAGRSAQALENRTGGVETNRANVSQVEIAWKAGEIASLPSEALAELAGCSPGSTGCGGCRWRPGCGGWPIRRLTGWVRGSGCPGRRGVAYGGVCGHEHAAENAHGDPGAFPIDVLLRMARLYVGAGADEGDDVNEQDKRDIIDGVFARVVTDPMGLRNQVGMVGEAVSLARQQINVIRNVVMAAAEDDTAAAADTVTDPVLCDHLAGVWSARAVELRRAAAGG
jgi:hypothetical protein